MGETYAIRFYLKFMGDEGAYLCYEDYGYWWPTFGGRNMHGGCDNMEGKCRSCGEEVQVQDSI